MNAFVLTARSLPVLAAILVSLSLAGCGNSGPRQYTLSGTINYAGQPVSMGQILLTPDSSKGNEGPSGIAQIKDGKFETLTGKGVSGGPYVFTISGYDGVPKPSGEGGMDPNGNALFEAYEMKVDLPKEDSTKDIDVPKQ
ncbi:MAG: hypothetical protein NXI22_15685 [bacterium]|nr:hypothetical protein [bacterium]